MKAPRKTKNICHGRMAQQLDVLRVKGELIELLDRLPDDRCRTLLLLRHGLGLSWPVIRDAAERRGLFYSERHLYRLYAQALSQAEALLEAEHEG